MEQIPDLKVVYIRFVERPDDACEPAKKLFLQSPIKSASVVGGNIQSSAFPKRLSVLDMLKLGKVVNEKLTESVNLFSFDINQMAWSNIPSSVEFTIEKVPFGTGGFRNKPCPIFSWHNMGCKKVFSQS